MPMRLQELIHKFEEGAGFRYLKFLLAICVMIAAAVAYDLAALRNLSTPEGMETAQLAWNISEGRGYTTYCIRPFDIHLLRKKFTQDHEPSNHAGTNAAATLEMQAVRLNGSHPDLANPPVYPFLLAGFFKVVQLSHPDLAIETRKGNKWLYEPDVWIGIFNQFLFIVLVGAVFFLARRLFDEPVAWVSSLALLGAELFWRFSLSGLSTILLMLIFILLIWVLAGLESGARDTNANSRRLFLLAIAAGVLAGLGGLTRYSFAWLMIPVVFWLISLPNPRRTSLAMIALAAFLLVMLPWLGRNYSVCGAPFGSAGYAIFENTTQFPAGQLERSLNVDFSEVVAADFGHKLVANFRELFQNELPRLGGSWVCAFFLVGLLVRFRSPVLSRLRWFSISCVGLLAFVQALGRTKGIDESSLVQTDNLLIVAAPLVFIYGTSLFFTLLEQVTGPAGPMRMVGLGSFCVLMCVPFILAMFAPYPSPYFAPYYPPWIQEKAGSVDKEGLVMSDVPWAVAWYGQRQSIELPLKYRNRSTDRFRNDFYAVDNLKPVNALYLTGKTLKALEASSLADWLQKDPDAALLNRLRRRVLDNQGQEDKKDEDFGLFNVVRLRLVANAEKEAQTGEDWDQFVLTTFLKSEVPTGFPLRRAPHGLFPELFLTDSERGKSKTIQSSK